MLEWGKTPRDFPFLVKVKSGYKAQLKHPQLMKHKRKQRGAGERCKDRECKDGPLRESGAGLGCCLIRRDRAGPPKREGSLLSRLTSRPAGRGNAAWLWATLSERDGELSLPAFTLILHHMYIPPLPLSHIVWNNSSWLLFPFFFFAFSIWLKWKPVSVCHNLFRLSKSTTNQYRRVE